MNITNDALKQLKKELKKPGLEKETYIVLNALLARLEAAEKCAKRWALLHPWMSIVKSWRASMGK